MPAPIQGPPAVPTGKISYIGDYIKANATAGRLQDTLTIGNNAVRLAATESAANVTGVATAGDVAAAEAAGVAAADFSSIAVIPVAVALLGLLDLTLAFVRIPAHINIPFIGRPFVGLADWLYAKVDIIYSAVYGYLEANVGQLITGFLGLFGYALQAHESGKIVIPGHVTEAQFQHVQREADQLWTWLQIETARVNALYAALQGFHPVAGTIPANVVTVIEGIRAEVGGLHADIQRIDHTIGDHEARFREIEQDLSQLETHLGQVHAVGYSVPDVSTLITHISEQVETDNQRTQNQVTHIQTQLLPLIPLGVLGLYGARGINNLVRLADDVCQCPRLPDVPDLLPEILAADFALKDGI